MKKKILSLFLALAMCLSLLPTAAFAADGAQDPAEPGEEILAPEQLRDPEKDPDPEQEQEGDPAGVSAPQTGAANSKIAVQATGGHSQYHTEICNTYGCTKHQKLTWYAISTVDQLKSASGETKGYYLTTDLELTEPWTPTGTVNLCLSGHSITLSAGTEAAPQSVITVNSGVQLNISNCISLAPGGTYDGIYYGGPYIQHAKNAVGPGITVLDGGTVELFDGDVTQNSDGVVVENGGTLSVRGDISENTGAGVRLEEGGTLSIISGGRILLNNGCGVEVAAGSNFTVSGGAEVRNNTKGGETCNVYLRENATMTLSGLSSAKIGVTVEKLPDEGAFVPVTSDDNASRSDQNCITSDNASYRVFYSTSKSNGNLVLDARPTPLHADHNSETFVNSLSSSDGKLLINGEEAKINSDTGSTYYVLPEGNYYLEDDLTLSCGLLAYSTNVVLCLNGHNITVTGTSYVIYTAKKTSSGSYAFTLTDCADEPGTLTHLYNQYANGGVCVRDGTFIMRGGKISGNNSGVYVYQGNEFKIYGGEISGNKGYGVSLTPDSKSYIYMTVGGTAKIRDNWADGAYNAATGLYEQGTTGTAKNVLFTDKPFKYITVDSTLTEGAEIGVTIWKVVTAERDCVAVATCGTALSADASPYVKYFKSDSDAYKVWSSNNNVVIGVWNSDDQIHPVCGAVCNHKDASGKPVHNENIVWTPVSSATGLNNGDNIYLTDDITLTRTWQISAGGTVNLCLNGHTITANGDFDAITLTSNTNTLNICDCSESGSGKITHGTKGDGTTYSGAGVYMTAADGRKATVNMYGGTITGNTGHTVTVKNVNSTRGGGVYVDSNAQFYMHGGSITENTANVGGGVYYTASNSLYVSGNVNITGNKDTSGAASNVNVPTSSGTPKTVPFCIGPNVLGKNAEIGLRLADEVIATGAHSPVAYVGPQIDAKDKISAYNEGNFILDNDGGDYTFKLVETDEYPGLPTKYAVNLYNGLHEHPICGTKGCEESGHDDKLWLPISDESALRAATAGYYYLTKDIILWHGTWEPKDSVVLCLNGCNIEANVDSDTIVVNSGRTFTLTDCKGTTGEYGKITHWGDDKNGRGVSVNGQNAEFIMYGGNISGNTVTGNGGGVYVNDRATFTMYGGEISGNKATGTNSCGGGVYVSADATDTNHKSTFNMYGGTISGNEATGGSGGGVYVYYSTFSMENGTIGGSASTGNKAFGKGGGGVYVFNGTFTMSGSAAVSGNSTADSVGTGHGGGVYVDGIGGTFTMSGSAAVSGNTASGNGGGVYVENKGSSFTMSGRAAVSDNTASGSGGGVYVNCSTFTMNAGTISGNETTGANSDGGGVCVAGLDNDTSTFTMKNGTISGNSAKGTGGNGGGVYVSQSKFELKKGTISGNNAAYSGGGVYVTGNSSNSGAFTMTGGTVTGNNAASTNGSGGGVYVAIDANMTVSGDVQITDNWKNGTLNSDGSAYEKGESGTASNLYLGNGKTVAIGTGGLTGEAKIGITTRTAPESTAENTVQFATGAPTDHAKFFTPDVTGQGYTITLPEGENNLYLSAHTHDWEYSVSADNQTIIAKCKDNTCTSSDGGSVTISKPKHEVYRDGKDATAKVTQNSWAADTVSDVTYKNYTGDETPLSPAPTDAGHYIASITVGGKTAWVDYEIGKATPKADDFIFSVPGNLTYDGSPKTATVTSTKIDASYVTVKYYQDGTKVSEPTNAGTYTVKIDVTESGNYTAKSDLTDENWAFTILKGTYNGTTTPKTVDIVKGRSTAQSGTLTVADFFAAETELPAGAKIASVTPASGTMMVSVTVNDGTLTYTSNTNITATENESYTVTISTTNYNNFTVTLTFHPVDKQPQTGFKFENAAVTKIYGNEDFIIEAIGAKDGSDVIYSCDPQYAAVATVDSNGKVTIKGAGTAVIKATASATDDYAEGVATYELTVNKKTLTKDDLEFTPNSTFTKEYDGNMTCTTATVQIKSVAKVNSGDALPEVKGAYAYDSKDATGATKVTFTTERTENTNYILPVGLKVENTASITKRVLTVGEVTTMSKQYDGETDAEACIASVPLNGVVDGDSLVLDTPTTDGSYYFTADFIDANAGQNKTINGTVKLYDNNNLTANYTFKDAQDNETNEAPFTATGEITPADGGSKGSVERTQKFTDGDPKTETIAWQQLLPAGQTWNYGSEYYSASSVTVDHGTDDNGALTYTITGGKEDDVVVFTVSAKCNNYQDFTYTVRVTLTARDPQKLEFKGVENGKVTRTYGDADFTVKATGANEYSEVTYESSDEEVATVDSNGKVTIKGAGTATIKAKASATPDYEEKEISYALTVNKLRIPVPTKGKNELEYTGREQTYLPDGLDLIYCTIESNKATNVIAGGSWHNAEVRLTDWSNTEWADGADSIAHRPYPFRITPKPVTVTALDKKITAGQPAPELTSADYTVTGLIGNDTLGGISLYYADPSDLRTAVTPDTGKAGTYAIVVTKGGTGSNNYAPTFVNGTLTIASRPSGGVVAVTYPVNVPGETERGSVSSNVKNASKGSTVTITVEPEDGFQLADLTVTDKDGNELPLTDKGDGKYTFTMPAGKVEVNATFAEKIETSPFADVSTDAYYYEAVKWAAEQGITGGVGGGLFAPDQSCTRAQIVTFLWRAAGSPEPKSMRSFSDVPEDSYYAKAVAWAVENGITVGTSATTFSPDATCTRAQGVTFLFRAAKASADGAPAFRDVAADAYYAAAVKWATDNSVTNGIGGGLFGSDNDCTRAQIVTFLWRLYAGK